MFHRVHVLFAALILGLAAVCPAVAGDKEASPFLGDYSGACRAKSLNPNFPDNQEGRYTFSIDADGKLEGKAFSTTFGVSGDVTGSITADGEVTFLAEFPNQAYVNKGTVVKTSKGHLKGSVTEFFGKDQPVAVITFDLLPK